MKKVLVFLVIFALSVGTIITTYADSSSAVVTAAGTNKSAADEKNVKISKDEAKEIALKFFKDNIGITIDPEKFNSSIGLNRDYQEPGQKIWRLSWRNYDGNKSVNLNAIVNADDGTIYRISKNESDRQRSSAIAEITETKAKIIADGFIKKVNPKIEKELKYQERKYPGYIYGTSMGQVTYNLNYVRVINGIEFSGDGINIGIDGITGNIKSYDYRWTNKDKLQFPMSDKVIGAENAYEILKSNADLKLSYSAVRSKALTPGETIKRKLLYSTNEYLGLIVDAKDGGLIGWDGQAIDNTKKKDISKAQKDKISSKAKTPPKPDKELTEAEAKKIIEREINKLSGFECKIDNIRYSENENGLSGDNIKLWEADFSNNSNKMSYMSGSIGIDANTGRVRSFYHYDNSREDEQFEIKLNIAQAYDRAISFVGEYYPDYINKIDTEQILRNEISYDENGKQIPQRNLYFNFPRMENGIFIDDNYISISFDAKLGNISDINLSWDDGIIIPKLDKLIDKNEVKKMFFKSYKPELQYMKFNKPDVNGNSKPEAKLVYKMEPSYTLGIDAKSGKFLDYEGNEMTEGIDTFSNAIKGHRYERELSILASQGIIDKKDFNINKQITRIEAIKMLVNAKGNSYAPKLSEKPLFVDFKNTDKEYHVIQLAIAYGILDNKKAELKADEKLTREEFAELIVRGMGYEKVANAKIAFIIDSKDVKKINADKAGYVALCRGFKIMEDIKGNFEPKAYVNIADASAAIYKSVSSIREIKR